MTKTVLLAMASDTANSSHIHVYEDLGSSTQLVWRKGRAANTSVAFDSNGNVYTTGARSSSVTTRKYDITGETVWSADHGTLTYGIDVGKNGGVCVVGLSTSSITVRYYDVDGNSIWTADHGGSVYGTYVDDNGYAFIAGAPVGVVGSTKTNRQYDDEGNEITSGSWPLITSKDSYGIIGDSSGNIYTVGDRTSDKVTTRKYNSSGTVQWSKDHGDPVYGVAVDGDGNVYTAGADISDSAGRKYNSSGTEITTGWPIDHDDRLNGCLFFNDHIYLVGNRANSITTRKYQPDGTLVWTLDIGATVYGIAGYVLQETLAPALALPIRLGLPLAVLTASPTSLPPGLALPFSLRVPLLITDREDMAPGLALNLALRLPTLRLEHPRAFQFPEVYALFLGGVWLPFSSISARRNSGGLNLSITIPSAAAELLVAVAANESETLRVLRGPRLPDGSVQLDRLWSATLDAWSYQAGAETGSITLQASAETAIEAARPRVLRDISYTNSSQGLRRVRCRIDTYLQPGDVALLGGGLTMLVNDLAYSIQSGSAFMEVQGF